MLGELYLLILASKFLFWWINSDSFQTISRIQQFEAIFWGYRYDLAVAAGLALVVTIGALQREWLLGTTVFFHSAVLLTNLADAMYYAETGRHVTYEINDLAADFLRLVRNAWGLYGSLLLLGVILVLVLVHWNRRFNSPRLLVVPFTWSYLPSQLLLMVLTVLFLRGGWGQMPLSPYQASAIGSRDGTVLALNGFYSMAYYWAHNRKKPEPRPLPEIDSTQVQQAVRELYPPGKLVPFTPKRYNLVFVFLESWSAKYLHSYGYSQEVTPNFDAWLKGTWRPRGMLAGGHRTVEGLFAALASQPNPLGGTISKTSLQFNEYPSLIKVLNRLGYTSVFFMGAPPATGGTGNFSKLLGFQKLYSLGDIQERPHGLHYWGVYDEDLYAFALGKMGELPTPFVVAINTLTTHDVRLPPELITREFSPDKKLNNFLNTLYLADKAFGEFIQTVSARFPNTVLVVLADHCGPVNGTAFEKYFVPFALKVPHQPPRKWEVILSQRDVAPTVLDLITGDYRRWAPAFTGKSLFSDTLFFADYFDNGLLGWIEDGRGVELNLATGDYTCWDYAHISPQLVECSPGDESLRRHALAFTSVTQELLFSGRTLEFKDFRKAGW